jgi:MerR family transcriptional regulator, light-induced transcriptional regulator
MTDGGDLTLQDAADALEVHYMTVYRYVRLGLLPARRVGRSWAVRRADLDEFRASRVDDEGGTVVGRGSADWTTRLERRLLAGDRLGAKQVLDAALSSGCEPAAVFTDVVAGAMRGIGDQWEAGTCDVAHEHRASVVAEQVLSVLGDRFVRRGVRRGVVLAGAVAGERHALPVRLVAEVVRLGGWEVEDLGADVPIESFALAAASAERLSAVAVSSTIGGNEDAVAATVAAIRHEVDVPVLVGGRAVGDEVAARALGGDGWAADARGVAEVLEALHTG